MGQGASRDTEEYRNGYPGKKDDPTLTDNIRFYRNEIKSKPRGDRIETIHKNWFGNYDLLEEHHGFIQWLFPIREDGMNSQAQQLQLHEAEAIRNDPVLQGRVLTSFELMLDFYGMKLDRETKTFSRSSKYKSRYSHLNHSGHNFLRITRILKCLGEVGLEEYKKPWCAFFINEISQGNLSNLKRSLGDFWIPVLKIEAERTELQQQAISLGLIEPPREKYPPSYGGRVPTGSGVRRASKTRSSEPSSSSSSAGSSSAAPAESEKKKNEEETVIEPPSPMLDDSQEEAKSPEKKEEAEAAPIVSEVVNPVIDDAPKDHADAATPDDAPAV